MKVGKQVDNESGTAAPLSKYTQTMKVGKQVENESVAFHIHWLYLAMHVRCDLPPLLLLCLTRKSPSLPLWPRNGLFRSSSSVTFRSMRPWNQRGTSTSLPRPQEAWPWWWEARPWWWEAWPWWRW